MDDGILEICSLSNVAENGFMPREALTVVCREYFELRVVGVNRLYAARGANASVDLLVRIWDNPAADVGTYVVLEDGRQYRVDAVQVLTDDDGLRVRDLTLVRLGANYDVIRNA